MTQSDPRLRLEAGVGCLLGAVGGIATVVPISPIDRTYSYRIPESLADRVKPGVRVTVPLGPKDRPILGFCIETSVGEWTTAAKAVESVADDQPLLSPAMINLGRWIARYYACPLGRTLHLMVPAAAKSGAGGRGVKWVTLVPHEEVKADERIESTGPARRPRALTARQANVLDRLRAAGGTMKWDDLLGSAGIGAGVVTGLARAGRIDIQWRDRSQANAQASALTGTPPCWLCRRCNIALPSFSG